MLERKRNAKNSNYAAVGNEESELGIIEEEDEDEDEEEDGGAVTGASGSKSKSSRHAEQDDGEPVRGRQNEIV